MESVTQIDPRPAVEARLATFRAFITGLIGSLADAGVQAVVLRNYEGFPDANAGSDVDLLMRRSQLTQAVRALQAQPMIRVVGYAERSYVAHLFVEGVSAAEGVRALAVDFIWSLNWKGQPYLATEALLARAMERTAGGLRFLTPDPVGEAATSLLASLMSGGVVKGKYFARVSSAMARNRLESIAILTAQFGPRASTRLVDRVIAGDTHQVEECVGSLRRALVGRSAWRDPAGAILRLMRYGVREFAVRHLPAGMETVRIDDRHRLLDATALGRLCAGLQNAAKVVVQRKGATPRPCLRGLADGKSVSSWPDARWIVEEWRLALRKRPNLTLCLAESAFYGSRKLQPKHGDVDVRWLSRLVNRLLPATAAWIVVKPAGSEAEAETIDACQARETDLLFAPGSAAHVGENACVVTASSQSPELTRERLYAAIIDILARRAAALLARRFNQP